MGNFIRKHIDTLLLVLNVLVFVLFTLVYPFVTFKHTFLNALFYILLSAPLITFLVLRFLKYDRKTEESIFYYRRGFNLLALINNYLFMMSAESIFTLIKGHRAPLFIIYLIFFALMWLINIFALILELGYLDQVLPLREYATDTAKEETIALAKVAKFKRFEEKVSTMYFFIALVAVLAVIFFIYPLVTEYFTIPLGGDFTQQQIPFYTNGYDDWWRFLKTGEFPLWDSNTFLGVNNIGSNSFYYSMNPFFLPILIFPRELIPQGISILMIGKFVLAAVTMRLYLKYMGVNEKEARFFAVIYAFSGWNTYYLWFNHFMEVAVIFPLIFLGIEKLIKEKVMWVLILSLGLMGFANYFFLMTVGVIGVLYAGFRYFQQLPKVEPSIIGLGIIAFALGLLLSSVVLFPSLVIALGSDRATDATYLEKLLDLFKNVNSISLKEQRRQIWHLITKWEPYTMEGATPSTQYSYKKFYPLISYYFPVLSNRSVALLNTSNYDNTISSLFSFSPVIILFIPSLVVSAKKKKVSHFVALAFFLFALFTPFFYHAFHGFTKDYGRWQLIVTFSLITYVAMSLPEVKAEKPYLLDISIIFNLIMMGITAKVAFSFENKSGFSYMYQREYVIYYQAIMLFISYLVLRLARNTKHEYYLRNAFVFFEIAVMGTITMIGHGFISYKDSVSGGYQNYKDDLTTIREIKALDGSYYRIFNTRAYRGNDNLPMRENYNGLSAFHSLYNFELMPFNKWSKINYNHKGWSLGVFEKRSMLNDFLQVKYYMLNNTNHVIYWSNAAPSVAPYRNVPNTYEFMEELSTDKRFVYKMKEGFTLGFGVDNVISYENRLSDGTYFDLIEKDRALSPIQNEELYLTSALLSYEDHYEVTRTYSDLVSHDINAFPHQHYTRLSSTNGGLKVKYYEFTGRRYPYEAQTRTLGEVVLPTPQWVSENGNEIISSLVPTELNGAHHVIEYTKKDGTNFVNGVNELGEQIGGEIIMRLPLSYYNSSTLYYNFRYRVFLYDENYELITFDDHHTLPSSWTDWKTLRSFHTPKAVSKIALVPIGSRVTPPYVHELFTYSQDALESIRQTSITNSLTDVKVTTNTATFKTNYPTRKFVVTTIPYDKGWRVTNENNIKIPVYRVQGGFVGFVSDRGEMSYTMSFRPQYFNMGLVLTFSAGIATLLLELNVYFFKKYKKKKAEENINV
ncbi:MAG: Bacterial membrane protein YfhO [Tenericutes bacterium ADurb.Bin024]|nr:MAG: Bacterial membrane protein YfhO [Tenericutes bacterium ADurb.Bin024]HQB96780.1 YfhO family protein [Bacilli bacterium]